MLRTREDENLAAAIEGMLILAGAGRDRVRVGATPSIPGRTSEKLGFGIAVVGLSAAVNRACRRTYRQGPRARVAALEGDAAHLRADAWTSTRGAGGAVLIEITGRIQLDAIVALMVRRDRLFRHQDLEPVVARCSSTRHFRRRARPGREAIEQYPGPSCPAIKSARRGQSAATYHAL